MNISDNKMLQSISNPANVYKSIYNQENIKRERNNNKIIKEDQEDEKLISIVCKRLKLPIEIQNSYEKLKLHSLYQWQTECLYSTGIIHGNNLIYCAPTSGGKTLIAELLILQKVVSLNKKAIFILPFVSLVIEKEKYFKRILYQYNLMQPKGRKKRVKSIFGDNSSSILYTDDIIICTIEKANGIINNIILGGKANNIGCIVVDEMHILGDSFNGFLLEILINKIKLLECKSVTLLKNNQIDDKKLIKIQLIGMSATVGNINQLASWFGADIYKTDFRPVPLVESVVLNDCLYNTQGQITNKILTIFNNNNNNNNNTYNNNNKRYIKFNDIQTKDIHSRQVITLTLEGLLKGQQIIIFCPTKISCQQTSKLLTEELYNFFHILSDKSNNSNQNNINNSLTNINQIKTYTLPLHEKESNLIITHSNNKLNNNKIIENRLIAIEKLKKNNMNTDSNLISSIEQGICYHHSGLTNYERSTLEELFHSGVLSIIVATSTLAAGVNLPAGRVIIKSLQIGRDDLLVTSYKQMCGRAGRAGQSNLGESFLILKKNEFNKGLILVNEKLPDVCSQMNPKFDGGRAILKSLLDIIMLGLCSCMDDIRLYAIQTLLYQENIIVNSNAITTSTISSESSSISSSITSKTTTSSIEELNSITSTNDISLNNHKLSVNDICDIFIESITFLIDAHAIERRTKLNRQIPSTSILNKAYGQTHNKTNNEDINSIVISRFGRALMTSNLNPDEGIIIYKEINASLSGFNSENNFHIIYLLTPLQCYIVPDFVVLYDWYNRVLNNKDKNSNYNSIYNVLEIYKFSSYYGLLLKWSRDPPARDAVDGCIGVLKLYSMKRYNDKINNKNLSILAKNTKHSSCMSLLKESEWEFLMRCKRIWLANILCSLVDGEPNSILMQRYNISISDIEYLQFSTKISTSKIQKFCAEIGCISLVCVIDNFKYVFDVNTPKELINLMEIPGMTRKCAKILYEDLHITNSIDLITSTQLSITKIIDTIVLKIGFELQDIEEMEKKLENYENNNNYNNNNNNYNNNNSETNNNGTNNNGTNYNNNETNNNNSNSNSNNNGENNTKDTLTRLRIASWIRLIINEANLLIEKEQIDKNKLIEVLINAIDTNTNVEEDQDDDDDDYDDDDSNDINNKELLKLEKEAIENEVDNEMTFGILNYKNRPNWVPKTQIDPNTKADTLTQIKNNLKDSNKNDNNNKYFEEEEENKEEDMEQRNKKAKLSFSAYEDSFDDDIWLQLDENNKNSVANSNISMIYKNNDSIDDDTWLELDRNIDLNSSISNNTITLDKSNISIIENINDFIDREALLELDKNDCNIIDKNNISIDDQEWLKLDKNVSIDDAAWLQLDTAIKKTNVSISDEAWLDIPLDGCTYMNNKDDYNDIDDIKDNNNNKDNNDDEAVADISISFLKSYKIEDTVLNNILNNDSYQDRNILNSSKLIIDDSPHKYGYNNQFKSPVGLDSIDIIPSSLSSSSSSSSTTTARKTANNNKILFVEDVININNQGFGWRNIKYTSHCKEFLQLITFSRCFSFEFIYKKVPLSFELNNYSNVKLANNNKKLNSFQKDTLVRWYDIIAWSCPVASSSIFRGVTTTTSLDSDAFIEKTKLNNPQVLIGISICFGGQYGYYIPLPVIPPYLNTNTAHSYKDSSRNTIDSRNRSCNINQIPSNCRVLICRYVGYDKIFNKCSYLSNLVLNNNNPNHATQRNCDKDNTVMKTDSNALILVNKAWYLSSINALHIEWNKGRCVEWRIISELMSNKNITKVSIDMKNKLICLLERNIIVKGQLEDPIIAKAILPNSEINQDKDIVLEIPDVSISNGNNNNTSNNLYRAKISCYRAISTMRIMNELTMLLKKYNLINLFRCVEMPLLYSVSEAEYGGINIDKNYFYNLKYDLKDRIEIIENYFKSTSKILLDKGYNGLDNINISAPQYINKLTSAIRNEYIHSSQFQHNKPNNNKTNEEKIKSHLLNHPLLCLKKEYSLHLRYLPLCNSILHEVFRNRVRANYNTLGTETGRVIISMPALQNLPKEIIFYKPVHLNFYEELKNIPRQERNNFVFNFNKSIKDINNDINQIEYVKVEKINKINNINIGYDIGRLVHVTNTSIHEPPVNYLSHSKIVTATSLNSISVADSWNYPGNSGTNNQQGSAKKKQIPQLIISFSNHNYISYPADKVYRLNSNQPFNKIENDIINNAINYNKWETNNEINHNIIKNYPRNGFIASEGYSLISFDYSQIELRILAHLSNEEKLISAFHKKIDVFKDLASKWKKIPFNSVTQIQRDMVKQLCYGLIYGAGVRHLVDKLQISYEEAKFLDQDFLSNHPGIPIFIKNSIKFVQSNGYIETIMGRKRYFTKNKNIKDKSKIDRQAVNSICQGSAADVIKLAMINIHIKIKEFLETNHTISTNNKQKNVAYSNNNSENIKLSDIRLILQIHDELLFEIRNDYIDLTARIIKECMENCVKLKIPLQIKMKIGKDWYNMKDYSVDDNENNNKRNNNQNESNDLNINLSNNEDINIRNWM